MKASKKCPKCGFAANRKFAECPKCGIMVGNFLNQKQRAKDPEKRQGAANKSALQNLASANALMIRQKKAAEMNWR